MQITNALMGAAAAWEVDKRLRYHSEKDKGRILDGLKLSDDAVPETFGRDDLPAMRFMLPTSDMEYSEGAPKDEHNIEGRNNNPTYDRLTLHYLLSTDREYGFVQREADGQHGLMEWIAKVKDAIETPAFPNTLTIADCDDANYNTNYVYDPETRRWKHPTDTSIWITWENFTDAEVHGGGQVHFESSDLLGDYENAGGSVTGDVTVTEATTQAEQPDAMLHHTVRKPVLVNVNEWEQNQTALTVQLEVILQTRSGCRGQRRFTYPPSLAWVEEV